MRILKKLELEKCPSTKREKKIGCFRSRPFWQGQKDSFSSLDARRSGRLYRAKGHGIHCRPILVLLQEANKKIGCLCNRPFWQGQKDSNPQQRFWRPTCYHYTMPLRTGIIIPGYGQKVKQNFCFFGNRAAGAEAVVLGRVNNRYKLARMARKRLTNAPLYVYNSMTG